MHRGRDVLQVLDQYEKTVKPSFESYILPTKKYADIIVSNCAYLSKCNLAYSELCLQQCAADSARSRKCNCH